MFRKKRKILYRKAPRRKISIRVKKWTFLLMIIAVFCVFAYATTLSNFFVIDKIEIENTTLINENLENNIRKIVEKNKGSNLIFLDTERVASSLLKSFSELESVTVGKNYPKTLEINFAEYAFAANIINETKNIKKSCIVNSIGYVVKENFENQNLPYIRIKSDEPLNTKTAIIGADTLRYILETIMYFEDKFGMKVTEVEYKKIAREIHLKTERDFTIWLDIQKPADTQFKKLKKALVKLDIYNEPLEYIDLRIAGSNGDKIIYKRR